MSCSIDIERYRSVVEACNTESGWQLDAAAIGEYTQKLSRLAADVDSDDELRRIALNYHLDHQAVAALYDNLHHAHSQVWDAWMRQAIAVLRTEGFTWFSDQAVDLEDLAQSAFVELVRSLPSYKYRSRLATWVYQVVSNRIRRMLRDSRAKKRAVRPESLDRLPDPDSLSGAEESSAITVHHRLLHEQVNAILNQHPDQRLRLVFHLWALEDRRIAEIGRIVRLHPSRVRVLLQQARALLQQHPAIQAWRDDQGA